MKLKSLVSMVNPPLKISFSKTKENLISLATFLTVSFPAATSVQASSPFFVFVL